jgi:DNA processing protein
MKDLFSLLCLASVPGIGSNKIRSLVAHFGSCQAVLESSESDLWKVEGIDRILARQIKTRVQISYVKEQLRRIDRQGIRILTFWDAQFPKSLKTIYDPPVILYIKGTWNEIPDRIALVGTRFPTRYGRDTAQKLGEALSERGIIVVSGMARGIDTCAHQGALQGPSATWAVLGCGIDIVYPPENLSIYHSIQEKGLLISEFPLGSEPLAPHFPRRNRIISGLCSGTVVIEAGEKSGALITAYMALDQGREVFAVPGAIQSQKSRGTHQLIKEGAHLVENVEDILQAIPGLSQNGKIRERTELPVDLTPDEKKVWAVLSEEPVHIDQIAQQVHITPSEASAILLSLELKNQVKQLSGMLFMR